MMKRVIFVVLLLFLSLFLLGQNQGEAIFYIVQRKDNLSKIAQNNKVPLDSLYKWNKKSETNSNINIGDSIIIGWKENSKTEKKVEKKDAVSKTENTMLGIDASLGEEQVQRTAGKSGNKNDNKKREEKRKKSDDSGSQGQKIEKHFSWGTLLLGILLGTVLGSLFFYFFYVRKLKVGYELNERALSQRIVELRDEKAKLTSEMSHLRSKIQSIEKEKQQLLDENVVLGEKIDLLKATSHEKKDNIVEKTQTVLPPRSNMPNVLYADAIIDDCFVKTRETPNEDSVFVLNLKGENTADFYIYDSACQRVVANPSFLEGCENQIVGNAMRLEIVSKGLAQKDASNGKWKVINKLKVIIR